MQRHTLGLAEDKNITAYTGQAKELWESMQDADFNALADALLEKVNALVPHPCGLEKKPLAFPALFDPGTWKMTVDTTRFSKDTSKKRVGQLTVSEVAEVVDTFYHEARHSEQAFRIARMNIEDSKYPGIEELAAKAAEEVVKQPDGKGKLTPEERKQATLWYDFMAPEGKYHPYKKAAQDLGDIAREIMTLVDDLDPLLYMFAAAAYQAYLTAYHDFAHERDAEGLGKQAGKAFAEQTTSTGASGATAAATSATEASAEKPKTAASDVRSKLEAQIQLIEPPLEILKGFSADPEVNSHVKSITQQFSLLRNQVERLTTNKTTEAPAEKLSGKPWYADHKYIFGNILTYLSDPLSLAGAEERNLSESEKQEVAEIHEAMDVLLENLSEALESLADQHGSDLISVIFESSLAFGEALAEEVISTTSLKKPVVELETACKDAMAYFAAL